MWVIAYFILENAVEVVPQKWIYENQCSWPSYKGHKLKSAIADQHEVADDWKLLPIRLLNNNKVYDDLIKARNACQRAQFTSDCSENESKRESKKKVLSSGSSSENEFEKSLPEIPKGFSERKKKNRINSQVENQDHPESSHSSDLSCFTSSVANQQEHRNKEFETQVLRKLSNLTIRIQQIGDDIASIRETLLNNNLNLKVTEEECLFQLPADSPMAFKNLEQFLENQKEYDKFVTHLEKIGGNTVYDCVKRIQARIITDELAFEFNWHGLKGKKAFKDSFLAKATIEAILKNKNLSSSEKNIEDAIKSWLRHAKDRLSRKEKENQEGAVPV